MAEGWRKNGGGGGGGGGGEREEGGSEKSRRVRWREDKRKGGLGQGDGRREKERWRRREEERGRDGEGGREGGRVRERWRWREGGRDRRGTLEPWKKVDFYTQCIIIIHVHVHVHLYMCIYILYLHCEGVSNDLLWSSSQSVSERGAVFMLQEEVEERRDGRLCEVSEEELHCLLRELESKLHDRVSKWTAQLCVCERERE